MRFVEVQWSLINSINKITKCKPFEVIHRYRAAGMTESPLVIEIKQLNEKLGVNPPQNDPTVQLREIVQKVHCDFNNVTLWSDSSIVIAWINSDKPLKSFVSNRIAQILDLTKSCQ